MTLIWIAVALMLPLTVFVLYAVAQRLAELLSGRFDTPAPPAHEDYEDFDHFHGAY